MASVDARLTRDSLERWLGSERRAALEALQQRAERSAMGERSAVELDRGTVRDVALQFGVTAAEVERVARALGDDLVLRARAGDSGYVSYGDREARPIRHAGAQADAVLGRFRHSHFALERRLGELTGGHRLREQFPPLADPEGAALRLRRDLREVPVTGPKGGRMDVAQKLMAEPTLAREQKERIFSVLAEVHEAYRRLDDALPAEHPNKGYQIVNWKHTRGEIDRVLDAAKLAGLSPSETEDAILASIFSDSVKTPQNFITHNLDGARAAAEVLPRYLDPRAGENLTRLEGIVEAIKEHQIGPPRFMGMILSGMISGKLGKDIRAEDRERIAAIKAKVSDPLYPEHLTPDRAQIAFTPEELALTKLVGVETWSVPHEDAPWYGASRAVIDGDSLINYASPDGWAKIVAIRGPDKGPFFQDATVFDSVESARESFHDARSVISDEARPLAEAGLAGTEAALARVKTKMEAYLEERRADVPFNDDGSVAFWNAPLSYPGSGELGPLEKRQLEFAKEIREKVVELLRAEQGVS